MPGGSIQFPVKEQDKYSKYCIVVPEIAATGNQNAEPAGDVQDRNQGLEPAPGKIPAALALVETPCRSTWPATQSLPLITRPTKPTGCPASTNSDRMAGMYTIRGGRPTSGTPRSNAQKSTEKHAGRGFKEKNLPGPLNWIGHARQSRAAPSSPTRKRTTMPMPQKRSPVTTQHNIRTRPCLQAPSSLNRKILLNLIYVFPSELLHLQRNTLGS